MTPMPPQPLPPEAQQMGQDPSQMGQDPMAMQQGMAPPPEPAPGAEEMQGDEMANLVNFALSEINIAKKLSKSQKGKEKLAKMGIEIVRGYEEDEQSRKEWLESNKRWIRMTMLLRENKTYPWPKASNIKYPLIATAAMQFSARAYPALVPSDGQIVKTKLIKKHGANADEKALYDASCRISTHMSYQLLEKMPNWEEDMDQLLMCMAVSGVAFKKTYHSRIDGFHHSHLVYPENLCVNYYAKSIEKAYRKTEVLRFNNNEVLEKVNNEEEYLDEKYEQPVTPELLKEPVVAGLIQPGNDQSTPHIFLACHTFWDLDGDGYEEPYIITVHKATNKVARIIARWDMDGVKRNDKGDIAKITPVEYFTAFPFIPNPDGSIYGVGFGTLLGSLNESCNTLINQLTDAGTLNNLQAGFIGKGLRLKMGVSNFQPGEWKAVNATGDDLNKQIVPLPTKEPSPVLMALLQMLVQSGNQLASIAEIFVGKMPGQNTPATTTQETVQQGMAVFTAIYKRVYRALGKEFKKLYRLNKINPEIIEEESKVTGLQLQVSDYQLPDWIVIPGADPTGDSYSVRQQKIAQIGSLIQLGTIDPMNFTIKALEANEVPNPQEWIAKPQPPAPDPKQQTEQAKQQTEQIKQQGMQQQMDIKERIAALEERERELKLVHTQQIQAIEARNVESTAKMDQILKVIQQHFQTQKGQLDLEQASAKHDLTLQQKRESHAESMRQKREKKANGART